MNFIRLNLTDCYEFVRMLGAFFYKVSVSIKEIEINGTLL